MPANARSLTLTDAYRSRLLALGDRVEAQAKARWPTIEQLDETDWPEAMAGIISRAQVEGVRLTAGYLTAYLRSETGRGTALGIDSRAYAGLSRDGRPLTEALLSPLIGVRKALKDGKSPEEALAIGLTRGTRMAKFEAVQTGRDALLDGIESSERLSGWLRNVAGTCAACMAFSGASGPKFEVHPGCECVPMPQTKTGSSKAAAQAMLGQVQRWGQVGVAGRTDEFVENWTKNLDEALSTNAEARASLQAAIKDNDLNGDFQGLLGKYAGGRDTVILLDTQAVRSNGLLAFDDFTAGRRLADTTFISDASLAARAGNVEHLSGLLRHEFAHSLWDAVPGAIRSGFQSRLRGLNVGEFTSYPAAASQPAEAFCEAVRTVYGRNFKPEGHSREFQELAKWLKESL